MLHLKAFGPKRALWLAIKAQQQQEHTRSKAQAQALLDDGNDDAEGGGAAADEGEAAVMQTIANSNADATEMLAREAAILGTTKDVADKLEAALTTTKGWASEAFVGAK